MRFQEKLRRIAARPAFAAPRVTLQIHRPAGYSLALTAALFLGIVFTLELIARSSLVQGRVPFQAYGTNHVQFEYQLKRLNAFVEAHGEPDCLIQGNSQALRSIDPQVFAQAYPARGQGLLCYNFSVIGTNVSTTLLFSQVLIDRFHPKLIVLGTSFLDYTESRENRYDPRFEENAWLDYQLGQLNLKGWLLTHSYAFRLLTLFSYGAPQGMNYEETQREVRKWNAQLTETGYGASDHVINPSEPLKTSFIKNFLENFGDFGVSKWNYDSLEAIVELGKQNGVQVVIVSMPYHPALAELRNDSGRPHPDKAKLDDFIARSEQNLQDIARRRQVSLITTQGLDLIPKNGWHDLYHLNKFSSPAFSRWLAEQTAAALANQLAPAAP